jgi:hypothetical protein
MTGRDGVDPQKQPWDAETPAVRKSRKIAENSPNKPVTIPRKGASGRA